MPKENLKREDYIALLEKIERIVIENGLKATTMDLVAASLAMSKRTLYEIFDSKNQMLSEVIGLFFEKQGKKHVEIFEKAPTMMHALVQVILYQSSLMQSVSPSFHRNLDEFVELNQKYRLNQREHEHHMLDIFSKGIAQGVFRPEVNYELAMKMLRVQLEALKRMEEIFPSDVTPFEAYSYVSDSFIRSIATPEGLEIIRMLKEKAALQEGSN